jgi:hypothetical protein
MDDFTRRLREDARRIRIPESAEFDERLRASLERAAAERPVARSGRRPAFRLWWASSLTGIAAAVLVIAVLNLARQEPPEKPDLSVAAVVEPLEMPLLKARKAVMTTPLEKELDLLESDIRKAENVLREDIGIAPRDD